MGIKGTRGMEEQPGIARWVYKRSYQRKKQEEKKQQKTNRRKMIPRPQYSHLPCWLQHHWRKLGEKGIRNNCSGSLRNTLRLSFPLLDPLRPSNCFYSHFYEPEMKYGMSNFKTENTLITRTDMKNTSSLLPFLSSCVA